MTIDEAIMLGGNHIALQKHKMHPKTEDALKLGIEALKFRANVKVWYPTLFPEALPGETKEAVKEKKSGN